jgi:alkylhydroperoxidase family enzyme
LSERIPLVDPEDPNLDPRVAKAMGAVRAASGRDYNVLRAMANHPELYESWHELINRAYTHSSLDPAHAELAYLTASVTNHCHY